MKSYNIRNSVSLRGVLSKISNQWAALTYSLVMHDAIFLALFIEFSQQRLYMLTSSFFYSFFLVLNLATTCRGTFLTRLLVLPRGSRQARLKRFSYFLYILNAPQNLADLSCLKNGISYTIELMFLNGVHSRGDEILRQVDDDGWIYRARPYRAALSKPEQFLLYFIAYP